ncbi:MAG: hypothetical protein IPQ07_43720 [Myxococcales bacterium]|nr:hypothetical protein [Myxococcales bacterium]
MNNMAAVARTPTPSDGRVPCPQCGGLVHPIAGRCKHCKADLADARGARPAAAAALPALAGGGSARPAIAKGDPTPIPVAPTPVRAIAQAAAEAAPILPPRPTGRMQTPKQPGGSLLRNWPVLVIILAGLAIAAAVVIMVWPTSTPAKADTRLAPPPAPERMDTNPLPPQGSLTPSQPKAPPGGVDPWDQNGGGAAPDPDIDPADPTKGPFATPGAQGGLGAMAGNEMAIVMMKHVCNRMSNCGNPMLSSMCSMFDSLAGPVQQPTCTAAQRCVDSLDQLDCNITSMSSMGDVTKLFNGIQACVEAQSC